MNLDEAEIQCPHCGEPMAVPVDPSQGRNQTFTEDCAVCCRPIVIHLQWGDSDIPDVHVQRE